MKILHTIPYFNRASGGPTSCTYNLVRGLLSQDADVNILTFQPDKGDEISSADFINYLPDDRTTPLWFSRNMSLSLQEHIHGYDIVHANTIWTWPTHLTAITSRNFNKPLLISPHGMLYPQALKVSAWKKRLIGKLFVRKDLNMANCIHATSEQEMIHIRNYGIKRPIAVIPNCLVLDNKRYQCKEKRGILYFGFTGRLNPIKNIDLLIKAWTSLEEKTAGCELVIIGDGEKEFVDYLHTLSSESVLGNIKFLGFLAGDELKNEINNLDYQILPSKSENFGMVVPEALSCNVPVIASTGTPWKILEDERCGMWIEPDIASLQKAILTAKDIPGAEHKEMGRRGRDLVIREYESKAVARKMLTLYEWLLGEAEKPSFVYEY